MDPNKPAPKTGVSGLKKPSAIPSIGGSQINGLSKQNEELRTKLKSITKESETLKAENTLHLCQINDLKDQVS